MAPIRGYNSKPPRANVGAAATVPKSPSANAITAAFQPEQCNWGLHVKSETVCPKLHTYQSWLVNLLYHPFYWG